MIAPFPPFCNKPGAGDGPSQYAPQALASVPPHPCSGKPRTPSPIKGKTTKALVPLHSTSAYQIEDADQRPGRMLLPPAENGDGAGLEGHRCGGHAPHPPSWTLPQPLMNTHGTH